MKNCRKNAQKSSNGITLIALVITIIVLLILAGISISMLAGDNSILQKATDAKISTERKSVIELAQTDILGQIAENKGETITETQLKTILSKYFEEFIDELPEDLSETTFTLTSKTEYGGYTNIALVDIYNGKISKKSENLDLNKMEIFFIKEDDSAIPDADTSVIFVDSYGDSFDGKYEYLIFEYNNKKYIITFDKESHKAIKVEVFSYRLYGLPLYDGANNACGKFYLKTSNDIQANPEEILEEYNPRMKVDGIDEEIDLTSCIGYDTVEGVHLRIIKFNTSLDFESYNGQVATISLTIDGQEVKWTGTLETYTASTPN